MTNSNCWIDDFHIKVNWLLNLPSSAEIILPSDFPRKTRQILAKELGVTPNDVSNWCPNPNKHTTPSKPANHPKVHFARNIARVFGFAPLDGIDNDDVWQKWWASSWPSFTPSETRQRTRAPADTFQTQYRD